MPFIHGNWGQIDNPATKIDFETNQEIEEELRYAPPASDPDCPTCHEPMIQAGVWGCPNNLWGCPNEDCPSLALYAWQDGNLVDTEFTVFSFPL